MIVTDKLTEGWLGNVKIFCCLCDISCFGKSISELAIFKAEDRTIIPVTGLPAEGKFGGEPYGENGYAYMAVTVTTGEHPAFYKIDTKTGKAVKGLTVEADAITTVGKMKYPSK